MIFPTPRHRNMYHQQSRSNDFFLGRNFPQQNQIPNQSLLNPDRISSLATKGADGLSKTLGNVQQVLNVIQTAAPIVQEYGPMIKNLPALYRVMKAMNEINDDDQSKMSEVHVPDDQSGKNINNNIEGVNNPKTNSENSTTPKPVQRKSGKSRPMLFI